MIEHGNYSSKIKSEELSTIESFLEKLNEGIFGAFYIMLKHNEDNLWIILIFKIIELLQLIYFCFTPLLIILWKNSIAEVINKILNKVFIVYYFSESSSSTIYLVIFYICFLIILTYLILMINTANLFSKSILSDNVMNWILRNLSKSLLTFLYMPILSMFFNMFNCITITENDVEKSVLFYSQNIECFKEFHFLHIFTAIFGILMTVTFGYLVAILYFDNNFNNNIDSILSKSTNDTDVLLITFKTILVILDTFLPLVSFKLLRIPQNCYCHLFSLL